MLFMYRLYRLYRLYRVCTGTSHHMAQADL